MPFDESTVRRDTGGRFVDAPAKPEAPAGTVEPRRTRTGMDRDLAMMYFPVEKAIRAISGKGIGADVAMNMSFAYDPEEAAIFLQHDWWRVEEAGLPEVEMNFLRGFLREFGE